MIKKSFVKNVYIENVMFICMYKEEKK